MKRKLLKQISAEWRANLWLGVELLLISCVLWFVVDFLASLTILRNEYMGEDIEHVYSIRLMRKSSDSPTYIPEEQIKESPYGQQRRIMDRIREYPGVECLSSASTAVYSFNFWSRAVHFVDAFADTSVTVNLANNCIASDTYYPQVFRLRGINGETPEQLCDILKDHKLIVTSNLVTGNANPLDLLNRRIFFNSDSADIYTIGAVVEPIKRGEFEPANHSTIIIPERELSWIFFRVSPDADHDFKSRFIDDTSASLNYGNFYIADVFPWDQMRMSVHHDDYAMMRNMYVCLGFLMLSVFLGVLGTFWFRTRQRAQEFAIRLSFGATRRQIFHRLLSEGLIVLTLVTPLAISGDMALFHYEYAYSYITWGEDVWPHIFVEAAAVYALVALMIVGGTIFPAIKAGRTQPAAVLAGE